MSPAARAGPEEAAAERRPRAGAEAEAYWWRFTLASVLNRRRLRRGDRDRILLYFDSIAQALSHNDVFTTKSKSYLAKVDGGEPQNILILGSDKRAGRIQEDPGARTRRSCCASTPTRTRSR